MDFLNYLDAEVNRAIYVRGAQGENAERQRDIIHPARRKQFGQRGEKRDREAVHGRKAERQAAGEKEDR